MTRRLALALALSLTAACGTVPPSALAPDAAVSVPDAATTAPDLALPIPPGSPRIVQRTWTGSDGSKVAMGDYFDTKLGIRCSPSDAEPGIVRCMPWSSTAYYGDAVCSRPLVYVIKGCTPEKYIITRPSTAFCQQSQTPTIYRVGATTVPTKLYALNDTGCIDVSAALTTTLAAYTFYDTSGQEPLSTFMQGRYGY